MRDDFPKPIKDTLADRVSNRQSRQLARTHAGMEGTKEQRVIMRRHLLRRGQEYRDFFGCQWLDLFMHDFGVLIKLRQAFRRIRLYSAIFFRVIEHGTEFRQDNPDIHDSGMRFLHQMRHELLHAVPIDPV
jgi:hypothetical protein